MKLSIVIINYKSGEYIEKCINSIHFNGDYEIIVIDNENNPVLMKKIGEFTNVEIISFTGNLGFAKGNNIAINKARGEYICTLNADVFLTKDYLNKCVEFLERHHEYSSIQGKLISESNREVIDSTGNVITRVRYAYNNNQGKKLREIYTPSEKVFGVCAAAAVYRKKYLDKVRLGEDYFDSDFFAYLEDVDLDWRLQLKGFNSYFLNTAIAYHVRGSSSNKSWQRRQAIRNRLFMIIKNDSFLSVMLNLLVTWPWILFTPFRKKNLKLLVKMFNKRRKIQSTKKVPHKLIRNQLTAVPWTRLIKIFFKK